MAKVNHPKLHKQHQHCSLFKVEHLEKSSKIKKSYIQVGKNKERLLRSKTTADFTYLEKSKQSTLGKMELFQNPEQKSVGIQKLSRVSIPFTLNQKRKPLYRHKSICKIYYPKPMNDFRIEVKIPSLLIQPDSDKLKESSFFDSSEEESSYDSNVSSTSESLSSISEGTLVQRENPKAGSNSTSNWLEGQNTLSLSSVDSDNANGDTQSVFSFVRIKGAKDKAQRRKSSYLDLDMLAELQVTAKSPGLRRQTSLQSLASSHNAQQPPADSFLQMAPQNEICQVCTKKIFNAQEVACFSICEHYMHELCLYEIIHQSSFKSNQLPVDNFTLKKHSQKALFCPKCKQL